VHRGKDGSRFQEAFRKPVFVGWKADIWIDNVPLKIFFKIIIVGVPIVAQQK